MFYIGKLILNIIFIGYFDYLTIYWKYFYVYDPYSLIQFKIFFPDFMIVSLKYNFFFKIHLVIRARGAKGEGERPEADSVLSSSLTQGSIPRY